MVKKMTRDIVVYPPPPPVSFRDTVTTLRVSRIIWMALKQLHKARGFLWWAIYAWEYNVLNFDCIFRLIYLVAAEWYMISKVWEIARNIYLKIQGFRLGILLQQPAYTPFLLFNQVWIEIYNFFKVILYKLGKTHKHTQRQPNNW